MLHRRCKVRLLVNLPLANPVRHCYRSFFSEAMQAARAQFKARPAAVTENHARSHEHDLVIMRSKGYRCAKGVLEFC